MNIRRSTEWIAFAASCAIILYAGFAAFDYALGPALDYCLKTREASSKDRVGVVAGAMARTCAFIGIPNEKRIGLHLSDEWGDAVLVYYEPRIYYEPRNNRAAPVLLWRDEDHLSVDLGEVKWLTPQIDHLGRVRISYTYSGAEPSLE